MQASCLASSFWIYVQLGPEYAQLQKNLSPEIRKRGFIDEINPLHKGVCSLRNACPNSCRLGL